MNVRRISCLLSVLPSALLAWSACAGTLTWDGGGGDGLWTTPNNWDSNAVPVSDQDSIVIDTSATIDMNGTTFKLDANAFAVLNDCTLTGGKFEFETFGAVRRLSATNVAFGVDDVQLFSGAALVAGNVRLDNCTYEYNAGINCKYDSFIEIIGGDFNQDGGSMVVGNNGGQGTLLVNGGSHRMDRIVMHIDAATPATAESTCIVTNNAYIYCPGWLWAGNANGYGKSCTFGIYDSYITVNGYVDIGTKTRVQASGGIIASRQTRLDCAVTNAANFDGEGLTWHCRPNGGGSLAWEVCGTNAGATFAGFRDNYSLDTLILGYPGQNSTSNTFVDNRSNNAGYALDEVQYVDHLVLSNAYTLNLGGFDLFYKTLTTNGFALTVDNGSLTQVTGATLSPDGTYLHTPEIDRWDEGDAPLTVSSPHGTIFVGGFNSGIPLTVNLTVSGDPADIDALRAELGGSGSGTSIALLYSDVADGGDLFFDWSFSHRDVSLDTFSAERVLGTVVSIR